MSPRKPPGVSIPDWVEAQITSAQAQGAFANLPGSGRPIPDLDRPRTELAWVADYLRRENVDAAALLPPALALAKEVETLPDRLPRERSEADVRALLDDLNERIRRARRGPQDGPPIRVRPVDIDALVSQWRESRPAAPPPAVATPADSTRRWLRRRG